MLFWCVLGYHIVISPLAKVGLSLFTNEIRPDHNRVNRCTSLLVAATLKTYLILSHLLTCLQGYHLYHLLGEP